jgi:hypothetical protein
MAGEEAALEAELQAQLDEQNEALEGVRQLVTLDPSAAEAASLLEELTAGIRDTEEALFGLKRQRLLSELDAMQGDGNAATAQQQQEPDPRAGSAGGGAATGPRARPEPGACCVFRHTDGRHYFGRVLETEGTTVWVQLAHPTR